MGPAWTRHVRAGHAARLLDQGGRTPSSTGSALALVAQVVERHGGTLTADVTYGSVGDGDGERIVISVLIVEDEPLIAEAHRTYLGRLQGFSVRGGRAHRPRRDARGVRGRATRRRSTWCCWILGCPTPAGSRWRRACPACARADIIAITSERDLEMVRAAVGHGALAYLLKPFTFAAFRDRLERYQRYREALQPEPMPRR